MALALCTVLATPAAMAQDPKAAPDKDSAPSKPAAAATSAQSAPMPVEAHVSHAPLSVTPAHESVTISAEILHPERASRVLLVYQTEAQPNFRTVPFNRASDGPYAAIIPAEEVRATWLAYFIEVVDLDGKRRTVFASSAAPHMVQVPEDLMDLRENALSERLGGRRSVVSATADYVSFGDSVAEVENLTTRLVEQREVSDFYYRIEGAYTYRPLRAVTEFSVRIGVIRGKAPVPFQELQPGQSEEERFDVGLNYGAPTVRFRLHDLVHMEAELLTSINQVGFSMGGGGALLFGDPYGSKLTLGFESVQTFGTRFFSRVDVLAASGVTIAPVLEITNMPSADRYGVRLLAEVGVDVGNGFTAAARGGYQARDAASGGPAFGGTLSYAF